MEAYIVITIIAVVIIFLLNDVRIGQREKPKSVMDELNEDPNFQEMKHIYEGIQVLSEDGTDQDVIPDGYGEFGYTETNPIPVNTILGNTAYLGRLRTLAGEKVEYERAGSTMAPNINGMIDIYDIFVKDNKITTLYICPYNKKNSERPPKEFKLSFLP
ncbi:MAG: hypothetical protein O6940_08030 [Ignavibacteria bacterium]|nr:hypothetical protein [Ignavibacteria bacterium]